MEEKNNDRQLVDEIRALRADFRRYAVTAIGVFVAMCVCGFVLFSNHASEAVIEGLASLIPVALVIGFAWMVCQIFQGAFNAKLRRKRERAEFAILSGRTSGSNRKP